MTIYKLFDSSLQHMESHQTQFDFSAETIDEALKVPKPEESKGRFFSALAARFFFFLLLIADLIWIAYNVFALFAKIALSALTVFQIKKLRDSLDRSWLSFKRSCVCAIALFVALFSPALGIMFSCMYFLMYDRDGVDEIVPESLRDQFKDFMPN